ncbi:hypothetical protein E3N88_31153 [Mikania micrantha]|uniref:Thioredoxin domain-containing protein n=1 Tax=Mikania micrantha TaxID=192012 RepID=A0A5N6MPI2_9ASTR|nr:hypothetical protein E3N88_31153 [Mikania micrantha]
MSCKQWYHSYCIVKWLEIHGFCPICMYDMPVDGEEKKRKDGGAGTAVVDYGSGEARSLMKEIARMVTKKKEEFRTLKLMLVHKNHDNMLADALGAKMEINVICYHHSFPYKYQGTLRVQNILSSVHYLMSLLPEELPLKSLSTTEDLTTFIKSTDRALLFLEFCGWTPKLMAEVINNGSENTSGVSLGSGFFGVHGETSASDVKKNQGMENEKITCNVDEQLNELPGFGAFIPLNESDFWEAKKVESSDGDPSSCSFEEFQLFGSALYNFTSLAREFFLPPERLKFGLVSERSLVSSLGVADTGSWLIMQYSNGCPSCAKVFKRESDLKRIIEINSSPVLEASDEYDFDPGLPADRPSVLLFIDRSSDCLKTRRKSKESLTILRELAFQHYVPSKMDAQNIVNQAHASKTVSHHPKLEMSTSSQKVMPLKDKITIITMNEGKHITFDNIASNLQGNSLQDVLAYVLQQKKQKKLSSLAKDVGFQLLSDDLDITMPEVNVHSDDKLTEPSMKDLSGSNVEFDKDQVPHVDDLDHSGKDDEKISVDTHFHLVANFENEEVEKGSNCSFFFVDGQFRLLEALSGVLKIPSLVIINPISHQHYVYPEVEEFDYSSISDFLHLFLNGSLLPYQRSKLPVLESKKAPRPPFVNQDFHEVDSIPHVNALKFMELVVGNHSSSLSLDCAWKKDVLVLFTSSWCGFCLRTELVLREVYRAFKGYGDMVKSQFRNEQSSSGNASINDTIIKLPMIYMMDCIDNDCSLLLKSSTKRDVYPSLLLYPAERKEAILYDGELSVFNIIKFIADHGGNSYWIYKERGTLWTEAEYGDWNEKSFKDASEHVMHEENHEILLRDRSQTQTPNPTLTQKLEINNDKIGLRIPYDSSGSGHEIIPGSMLVATQKLAGVYPFASSKILIVKVSQTTGFQGLIINKFISWDSISSLEEGLDSVKQAPLSYGGPVITRELPLVSLTRHSSKGELPQVLPDIYFLDQLATINLIQNLKLHNRSMTDYWFFVGYSAWNWNQLFDEIADGSWNLINGTTQQFDWPMT